MSKAKISLFVSEIAAALILILFLVWCVKANDVRNDIPIAEMKNSLLLKASDPDHMKEAGAMKLKALYGLASNDYEEVLLYIPVSNMDAEEMLLIRCRDKEQLKTVEEAMNQRIDYQTGIFESYGVDQMALIRQAKIVPKGLYCLYVCDKNSSDVRDEFVSILSN